MGAMADGRRVRAFVAIELDGEIQAALGGLQRRLKKAPLARLGRWVAPESIHLTLKFLGDVPVDRLAELEAALQRACEGVAPFDIALFGLGCFPNLRRPRVVWVSVEERSGVLKRLQSAVERELARAGFRPEGGDFTPHLTLARIRDRARSRERAELGAWIGQQCVPEGARMRVSRVSLMRSVLGPGGAVYSRLCEAPLRPEEG